MEATDGAGIASMNNVVKRRRSNTIRRPRSDSYSILETRDISSSSRTPPSENASKSSSGDDSPSFSRKELNLNDPASTRFIAGRAGGETLAKRSKNDEFLYDDFASYYGDGNNKGSTTDFKRSSEGVLAPANWKNSTKRNGDFHGSVGLANGSNEEALPIDKVPKKVTLKLKGVARTIQTTTQPASAAGSLSSKPPRMTDGSRALYKGNSDDDPSLVNKQSGSMETPWKEFSRSGACLKDSSMGKVPVQSGSTRQADKSLEPVRKSKRVPKRRILDGAFDEDEEDEELRYLGRLKTAKVSYNDGIRNEDGKDGKKRKLSEIEMDNIDHCDVEDYESYRKTKDGKKLKPGKDSEDTDYNEDEDDDDDDIGTDDGTDQKRKKPKKESLDSLSNGKKGALTTRQRALQSGRDASSSGSGLIEFPDGLPLPPRRKQKEQLSEEEQLKKAEAAQRRKMQVEKANRESQAEAIRKILGQDSNRKKREDKARKRRDEIAQEKAAYAATFAANTVRWVMGPAGTVVTFPEEMGLPPIFSSKPCSYPPPREKCAGPSCTNPFKYRDSKSNLPLCSLECYRSVNGLNRPVTTT